LEDFKVGASRVGDQESSTSASSSVKPLDLALDKNSKTNLGSEERVAEYERLTEMYDDFVDR
jgi:hypothetical protein